VDAGNVTIKLSRSLFNPPLKRATDVQVSNSELPRTTGVATLS